MATVRISQKNEISTDIDVPDEWPNTQKEKYALDIAKQFQLIIDEFFISKERFHVNRCQVIIGTQTVRVL